MASTNELASSPGQHTFSASQNGSAGGAQQQNATVHKRTYQACLPCRRRKVRCDLGSVDDPGDPPCQRCRREKKDCVFSETRRKRKADEEGSDLTDDYVARNKRSSDSVGNQYPSGIGGDVDNSGRMMPGFQHSPQSTGTGSDQARQTMSLPKRIDKAASNRDVANETAAELFQRPIVQPGDALHMLVHAAARTENEEQKGGKSHIDRERLLAKQTHRLSSSGQRPEDLSTAIDPAIMAMQDTHRFKAEADVTAAIQAWSRLRFVQAGWLTAREAISYIDYFYENLGPLSPISPPDFSDYAEHPRLLEEEPMLTVTLLTIASRYKLLDGPGGATRSFRVHDKLWVYLQGMVMRMFWGQEQFGGGFCGAGGSKTQKVMDAKRRGLRSLGTAESLLLLSDWLPRSMHFNPDDDAGELLVPIISEGDDLDDLQQGGGVHAAWTEPAIRSDRMSWSLVGMAYTLSWELGVFDSLLEDKIWCPGPQSKTSYDGERADRIGRMLLVYVSQSCGRLGYPNMMPSQGNETNFNFLKMDVPEGTYPGPYGTITETDKIQRAWAELTALMRQSNTEMFESKTKVSEVIKNGSYIKFLEDWGPRMKEWKDKFEQTQMPEKMRHILRMEWEYARTYIFSVSLQAVVESCAAPSEDKDDANQTSVHTPPALFSSKVVDIHKQNRVYIEELIEAARNVLRIAVDHLYPLGVLRHAPVRTHFRILSGAMFLLKSFAVGGKESEVSTSLYLLDKTVKILRDSVIDDVHLSLRIADLLKNLTVTIRQKFVRLAVPSRSTKQRSSHAQRPSTSQPTSAPKSATASGARATANTPVRGGHIQGSQSTTTGPNGAATPPGSYGTSQESWYSALGLDEAPPLVNLKDESITIMPPPDLSFANQDFYGTSAAPVSPHSSNTAGGLGSPTIGSLGGNRPRNSSFDNPGQMPFTPTQASFSPMSTGSGGGYDWLTLDFNPILANGGMHFGPGDQQSHHNGSGHPQGQSHNTDAGDGLEGQMDRGSGHVHGHGEDTHAIGASPWTMGAFGPEISEGLEMLGALGALVWDPEGQPGGGHSHNG